MMEYSIQIVIGWLCSLILQGLKKWNAVPWMNATTSGINRAVSALVAALAAVGISFHYDAAAGTLLIAGLTLASIVNFGATFIVQFFVQHVLYKTVVKT